MRRWRCILALVAATGPAWAADSESVRWPGGATAAVALTYDDALDSQLDRAAPALKGHGLRGTFYLVPGNEPVARRLEEWRQLARDGHELGNHTLYHGCSKSFPNRDWVRPWDDLDVIDPAQLLRDIRTANTMLKALDGQSRRTFAAPCYDLEVSGHYFPADIVDEFVAIRNLAQGMDETARSIWEPEGVTGEQLIGWVEANTRPGALLVLVFHGVGGDHLAVSAEAHASLLAWLAARPDTYWTDSYLNIMDHVLGTGPDASVSR